MWMPLFQASPLYQPLHVSTCILEHTVLLQGFSFKEPEYGFDFGLSQLSPESSREEVGRQPPERQDFVEGKNRAFWSQTAYL